MAPSLAFGITFGIVALSADHALAQDLWRLGRSSLDHHGFFAPVSTWKTKVGDDPGFASLTFDDSSWQRLPFPKIADDVPGGKVWFRLEIEVEEDLEDEPLSLWLTYLAAVEVYLDGERISVRGDVEQAARGGDTPVMLFPIEPIPVRLAPGRHVIALRIGSSKIAWLSFWGTPTAICLPLLGLSEPSGEAMASQRRSMQILRSLFAGAAACLALLFFFLFLFQRSQRENLAFALCSLALASMSFNESRLLHQDSLEPLIRTGVIFRLSLLPAAIFGLLFYYLAFTPKVPRRFWVLFAVGTGLGLAVMQVGIRVLFAFAMVCLLEELRVLAVAVRRRMDGAWIVGIGGILSITAAIVQMAPTMVNLQRNQNGMYLYGFFALLVSISVYLARSFARLAAANAKKELELEESKAREAVLRELEVANRSLKETQAQLVQSAKMASLGQLVAGVAHEINTPVGAIFSAQDSARRAANKLKEALEAGASTPEGSSIPRFLKVLDDGLKVIETGSGRVTEIVRRLKSFARLDQATLQRVDLHEGIEDSLMLIQHELKSRIRLERRFGALPPVTCYPSLLNQVFLNILINAVQAIEGEGQIEIETTADDLFVRVSIRDSGQGIQPEHLSRIFDPGFTTKGVKVGTGLGLSISYRIVEQHQGKITVESEPGKGSKFTVHIPINSEG